MGTETHGNLAVVDLALKLVNTTIRNVFIHGKAGTGKTTFLKQLKEQTAKNVMVDCFWGVPQWVGLCAASPRAYAQA